MNVLGHYTRDNIEIGNAMEIDSETHYCKISYNEMPLIIKTNKICFFKKRPQYKNNENYVNISITSKEYLEWFDRFYHESIELFHECSKDWFEEELTLSDIEFSFINPLKSNIRNNCFDVACTIDETRLHIVDSNDKIISVNRLEDSNVIPTFHIKGIKFNSKHFMFDIELNNLYVLTDSVEEPVPEPVQEINAKEKVELPDPLVEKPVKDESGIEEVNIDLKDLEEIKMDFEELNVYKSFEIVNKKIKENLVEHLSTIFASKKIKINNLDLCEMVNDEDE